MRGCTEKRTQTFERERERVRAAGGGRAEDEPDVEVPGRLAEPRHRGGVREERVEEWWGVFVVGARRLSLLSCLRAAM